MISLLIGIFLIILFIVTIVLSVSTWRAWHIVAVCLTFLAAVGLVIVGSLSLKTHNTWRSTHAKRTTELAQAEREGLLLEHGDPRLVEPETPSVNDMQHRLNRVLLDRGRVWRRCTPAAPAATGVVVSTVPPTETGQPGDPNTAKPNGITAEHGALRVSGKRGPEEGEPGPDCVPRRICGRRCAGHLRDTPTDHAAGRTATGAGGDPASALGAVRDDADRRAPDLFGRGHGRPDPGRYSAADFRDDE